MTAPAPGTAPAARPAGGRRRTAFHPLRVAAVEPLCADAAAVTLDVPDGLADAFAFAPGQSLTLRRVFDGREERRSYSICAAAGEAPKVGVRLVPGGRFSTWLVRDARPGDTVEAAPPSGRFHPEPGAGGRHVCVAAGSGITPVLSIAATLLRTTDARVTLVYGNRRADTVMFADELADLKDAHGTRFELVHVLSREVREADLLSGRLDAARIDALLDAFVATEAVDHWWLCGPFGMVEDARAVLRRRGVPADRVHRELFFVDAAPPPPVRRTEDAVDGPASRVSVVLDGRTSELLLPRDVPVLDAAQRHRPDLPFACKGGVCGTCRVLVRDGEVRMRRNYALDDTEVAAGYALSCQALPVTERVVVDYDA
ncbi:1,2-phenylacetyl-CoA epoxidase subunit PaaE [Nocardiopsis trehalosi]|uniref:1,2-phenylacetyl-CoA epoxidase subunit PaaE n=1 Tax=Nocardiopsis trehalosi TaxID=109329 RepID=UPI00083118E2|nr:1,2-phenylacetyl-CoA epoxidase subunit PaaE [Nocardiopsis trehalosi]